MRQCLHPFYPTEKSFQRPHKKSGHPLHLKIGRHCFLSLLFSFLGFKIGRCPPLLVDGAIYGPAKKKRTVHGMHVRTRPIKRCLPVVLKAPAWDGHVPFERNIKIQSQGKGRENIYTPCMFSKHEPCDRYASLYGTGSFHTKRMVFAKKLNNNASTKNGTSQDLNRSLSTLAGRWGHLWVVLTAVTLPVNTIVFSPLRPNSFLFQPCENVLCMGCTYGRAL
ncbi:hypothetical protein CEXT_181841 [Caerostris extrusa]|uniref:Uncharacterized protein n=1 Tax=Caerostris extrusa TaxID=172846 RepID=A0AAV4QMN7_CAEEX|nr:hypothetical protein CEXT_181841 [Caerostris extrusa]